MTEKILTNLDLYQIEKKVEEITSICSSLNPELLDDSLKLARYDEILDFYYGLLSASLKKARISESNLRLLS